jgi:hypothetical protein
MRCKLQNWVLIIVAFIVSNFLLLINQGVFWDDWELYNNSRENLVQFFARNGVSYVGDIHFFLQNVTGHPAILYHSMSFLFGFLSIAIFYKILEKFNIESNTIFILTLLFAVMPYNQAKQTMICMFYSFGFFLFLIGVLFFINSIQKRNIILRLVSFPIIILSFNLLGSALVVWLSFILLYSIYLQPIIEFKIAFFKKVFRQLFLWLDFVLLPFVYWIIQNVLIHPTGVLAEQHYNEPSIKGFLLAPINIFFVFITNIFGLFAEAVSPMGESKIFVIGFVVIIGFIYYFFYKQKHFVSKIKSNRYFLFTGVYFFIAGVFPYVVVGKYPDFSGFATRAQIFLPIGVSLILLYIISLMENIKYQKIIVTILVSSFIIANINAQIKYTKSWFKQEALIVNFSNETLMPNTNYLLIDQTTDYDENERGLSHWALSGIMRTAVKKENSFVITSKDRKEYRSNTEFKYYILIEKGELILNSSNCIKFLYLYYFNHKEYLKWVEKIIDCKVLSY